MGGFIRRFAVKDLIEHRLDKGLAALFDRWVLPGECAGTHGLRLAVRNGYLNFYVKGQSVGKLQTSVGGPRLKLHRKYKELAENGSPRAGELDQKYEIVNTNTLMSICPKTIDGWIRTAETYAGDEKRFVDDLVAVTPGTIDLEMGLPADDDILGEDRTAPRMDLVVAQGTDIAFWEAKCAVNGELRARATYSELADGSYDKGPHVVWQLRRYQRWAGRPHRLREVRDAYLETAQLLLKLAEVFDKRGGAAVDAWRNLVAAGEAASVILPPGIVVADYCPTQADGELRAEAAAYALKARSFDGHKQRLVGHGVTVVTLPTKPSGHVLPTLHPSLVSDVEQPA